MLNDQTRSLIAQADSPNLYWALTELASQPVELRQGLSYESRFWEFTIHNLPDLDRARSALGKPWICSSNYMNSSRVCRSARSCSSLRGVLDMSWRRFPPRYPSSPRPGRISLRMATQPPSSTRCRYCNGSCSIVGDNLPRFATTPSNGICCRMTKTANERPAPRSRIRSLRKPMPASLFWRPCRQSPGSITPGSGTSATSTCCGPLRPSGCMRRSMARGQHRSPK